MKIRNIVLQSLSALVIGSSLCASPDDVHTFMEAHKQKLAEKIITTINGFWAEDAARPQDERVSLNKFKKQFDEYRSYFPQGDAQVDQTLRNIFDMRMREQLLRIMSLNDALNKLITKKEKGFIHNIQPIGMMVAGFGLICVGSAIVSLDVIPKLLPDNLEAVGYMASAYAAVLGLKGIVEGLTIGQYCLQEEIHYLDCQIRSCALSVDKLNQAYAYAFPGEGKLSNQVQALFQQVQEIEALCRFVPD